MRNPFIRERKQSRTQGRFSRIKSECIGNINYNPISGTMVIYFVNPEIGNWRYFSVPPFEAAAFIESSSRGSYFNMNIRGRYEYERVE